VAAPEIPAQPRGLRRGTSKSARKSASRRKSAKGLVSRQLDVALQSAGSRARTTASSFREVGSQLRERGESGFVADLTQSVAGYVDRVADYFDATDASGLVADIETYGRKYPAAVAGAAFTVGLLASRVVKVSSAERFELSQSETEIAE
jgi:hypothetical protein